jgi:Flp pilus assembly protein TadB
MPPCSRHRCQPSRKCAHRKCRHHNRKYDQRHQRSRRSSSSSRSSERVRERSGRQNVVGVTLIEQKYTKKQKNGESRGSDGFLTLHSHSLLIFIIVLNIFVLFNLN